jgi:hypothetical protein
MPGVIFSDVDESHNNIRIAVDNTSAKQAILDQAKSLNIPSTALVVEIRDAPALRATLSDRNTTLSGGLKIFGGLGCSLGVVGQRHPNANSDLWENTILTASHCTSASGTIGGLQGTTFHQPSASGTANVIGVEIYDPPTFSGVATVQLAAYADIAMPHISALTHPGRFR